MGENSVDEASSSFPSIDPGSIGTSTLSKFVEDYSLAVSFLFLTVSLAGGSDYRRRVAVETLAQGEFATDDDRRRLKKLEEDPDPHLRSLRKFAHLQSRNIVNSIAESYLWYLSNILQQVMQTRHDVLKTDEKISWAEIIDLPDKDKIIEYLIDKKVTSLSYGGINGIQDFFLKRLGLPLFDNDIEKDSARLLIELRNINVHNRGFVNRTFLSRMGIDNSQKFSEGELAHQEFDDLGKISSQVVKSVMKVDISISRKFALKNKKLNEWGFV